MKFLIEVTLHVEITDNDIVVPLKYLQPDYDVEYLPVRANHLKDAITSIRDYNYQVSHMKYLNIKP